MSVARAGFGAFVLGRSIHAVGGHDKEDRVTSMERYCVASDSWAEVTVSDGALGQGRSNFGSHTTRVKVDLFDSLIANA
jgi:hypothetical protein